jgi:hypothetical protein
VEEGDMEEQEQEQKEQPTEAAELKEAAAVVVENGEEMKPKPKLHLPDFG